MYITTLDFATVHYYYYKKIILLDSILVTSIPNPHHPPKNFNLPSSRKS